MAKRSSRRTGVRKTLAPDLNFVLKGHVLRFSPLTNDFFLDDVKLRLTSAEREMLTSLVRMRPRTLLLHEIYASCTSPTTVGFRATCRMLMHNLRSKLGVFKKCIQTVYSYGYEWTLESRR